MATLTAADVAHFKDEGFHCGLRSLSSAALLAARAAYAALETKHDRQFLSVGVHNTHLLPWGWAIASSPPAVAAAAELLGSADVVCLGSHVFCKYGPSEEFVSWHQDATYWRLSHPAGSEGEAGRESVVVSVWTALDDVPLETGPVRMVPGSHKAGYLPHELGAAEAQGENLLSQRQLCPVAPEDEATAVSMVLKAGEVCAKRCGAAQCPCDDADRCVRAYPPQASIHDGLTVHGSEPNRSQLRRLGVTHLYARADVVTPKDAWPNSVLVNGAASSAKGALELLPTPASA